MGNEDKSQKERCQSNPAAEKRIGNHDDKITSGRDLSSRPWVPPRCRFLPGLPPGDDSLRKRVNNHLAMHRQTTTQTKDWKMFDGYWPFVIKHFYWNLNQAMGTWFDVYPNEDLITNGQYPSN